MAKPHSLLLITVDCLRADHVSFLGYPKPTTPFLDSLAKESLIFRNAIVAGTPTYHSFPAIMASRYPLMMGRGDAGLRRNEPTLATTLRGHGYATAGFVAANPYLSHRFGYAAGFETYGDFMDPAARTPASARVAGAKRARGRLGATVAKAFHRLGPLGRLHDELYFEYCHRLRAPKYSLDQLRRFPAADALVDHATQWLAETAGRPFFLWLHFMEPHAPYYPTERGLKEMGLGGVGASRVRYLNSFWNRSDIGIKRLKRYRDKLLSIYDSGIRAMDSQIANLVETMRKIKVWDDCVFAFTGDHGEEFLEHGGRYHFPAKVGQELIHVPLLLRAAGASKTGNVDSAFSLVDLAPTLLQSVSADIPDEFRGLGRWPQLLAGEPLQDPVITECIRGNPFVTGKRPSRILSVRQGNHKLVFDLSGSQEQLFDLEKDPREESPLPVDVDRSMRRRLLEHARQHLANSVRWSDPVQRAVLSVRSRRWELQAANAIPPVDVAGGAV